MKFFINKNERGITLIALIVTIVVLLILAGVTIANISGGDDILEQATTQRDKTKISSEKQILENAVISITNTSKHGNITEDNLRQELSNKNVEVTKSGGLFRIVFKDSNNLYKMDQEGEYFYWEDMAPKTFYAKLYSDGTLIFSSDANTTYKDCYPNAETDLQPVETKTNSFGYTKANVKKVIFHDPIVPTTCSQMFSNCSNLQDIENLENLHTENVTSMYYMFFGCNELKGLNLKYFDTSNVNNMSYMFYNCQNIERLDFKSFNTSNVENIEVMFYNCINLKELNLPNFDLTKAKSLVSMFNNCTSLKIVNLSNWNTSNIQNMRNMFINCRGLEILDLSSFDTNNVTNMNYMFGDCRNLKTIYVSDKFVTSSVTNEQIPNSTEDNTNSSYLFLRDTNLVGGNGTKYSVSHTNKTYARVDGGPTSSTPGYFTLKP